jgi:carboxypeptidase C (cathepsin A)
MPDEQARNVSDHEPPPGSSTVISWRDLDVTATAGWTVLRKQEKPLAEVFSTSYVARSEEPERPVTFVFNGGPGAASAFLHVGALGPRRVDFPADGSLPAPPPRLVPNDESWLAFTDLVFVDPVGTGFSRLIEPGDAGAGARAGAGGDPKGDEKPNPNEYYSTARDLEAMGEFIGRWLSDNGRWGAPVFLAGESYGGYRVGRLVRTLQETSIVLSGAILISPALEPAHLSTFFGWGDYDIVPWIDVFPTMVAAAAHHGRSRALPPGTPVETVHREAEAFATGDYATFLARGASMPAEERERIIWRYAELTGLDPAFVARAEGRVRVAQFTRELLRADQRVLGAYDASVTASDPFPDRDNFHGADPTLVSIGPVYTTAVNRLLRSELGLETDREYKVLNSDVITAWKNDEAVHYVQFTQGATDDFRYGMSVNPHLRAFITHGRFDLVTPYYATDRMRNLMRMDPSVAERLTVRHFDGGHMFYAWEESRRAFTEAIAAFVADATAT